MTPPPSQASSPNLTWEKDDQGGFVFCILGRIDSETAAPLHSTARSLLASPDVKRVTVDLSGVTYFDDYGALLLFELREALRSRGLPPPVIANASDSVRRILAFVKFEERKPAPPPVKNRLYGLFLNLGETVLIETRSMTDGLVFLGEVVFALGRVLARPRSLRFGDTVTQMEKTGVDALPVVGLISFLLGLVMAFMSSLQLRQFGANIYVASLVALAMVSELGPIMTAIVVSGRSGSAFAAELATMKIYEEVDALTIMGFDPVEFLTLPRLIASLIMVPLLTLFADVFAITGGLVVGVTMLDLTPATYIAQTLKTLTLFEVFWGLLKAGVFSVIVSLVGCLRGFQARGGAAAVGNAATSAVVTSIFFIILFDSAFAVMRSYW